MSPSTTVFAALSTRLFTVCTFDDLSVRSQHRQALATESMLKNRASARDASHKQQRQKMTKGDTRLILRNKSFVSSHSPSALIYIITEDKCRKQYPSTHSPNEQYRLKTVPSPRSTTRKYRTSWSWSKQAGPKQTPNASFKGKGCPLTFL